MKTDGKDKVSKWIYVTYVAVLLAIICLVIFGTLSLR